jgi:signal transduction histidine kinase/CheY-like chemotaxis protein
VQREQRELILGAWAARYRQPLALREHGRAILAAAAGDAEVAAWGALHSALGERAAGQPAAAGAALAQAEQGFAQAGHDAGLRACRALRAQPLVGEGRGDEAAAVIGDVAGLDGGAHALQPLQAYAAQFVLQARAMARIAAGCWDDALRDRYAALRHARATADDGAIAHALADLASLQADLSNADDALTLANAAVEHGERAGRTAAWSMAAFNRLSVLLTLQRHAEAAALAHELLPVAEQLHPRNRESAWILFARASLHGGDVAAAEALLERSVQERQIGHLIEWTVVRAELHLARGEAAAAATLCEAFFAAPAGGRASAPDDRLLLHRVASAAHEALGDPAAALRHARSEHALHAEAVGRGARARRLSLEIEHRLDQERWQREQAQQREEAAVAERARLDELNRALEAANAAKTRFLAAASHDLRQPVQALALNMAALEQEPTSPAQAALVQRMARSLRALMQMFDVLLDISRLDAGVVPVAAQPVDLVPLLQRLADECGAAAAARGLRVRLRLPRSGPSCLTHSDPVLLERCLRNLLDNALKYTPRGGVLLALRRLGGGFEVQVVDTGIGMAPAVLERAFDEFFQADNPERDRARGLGLGLAIVQRLLRLLGHGLSLHSQPGRGTRAAVRLPQAEAAPARVPVSAPAEPARALCLAVVDDDADVRDALAALLRRWGHRVLAGADARAVRTRWRRASQPEVHGIVCDLRLRGGDDGIRAVAALREAFARPTPALIVTGDIAPDRLQALRDHALPWLAKPVMPMRLRSWLATLRGPG